MIKSSIKVMALAVVLMGLGAGTSFCANAAAAAKANMSDMLNAKAAKGKTGVTKPGVFTGLFSSGKAKEKQGQVDSMKDNYNAILGGTAGTDYIKKGSDSILVPIKNKDGIHEGLYAKIKPTGETKILTKEQALAEKDTQGFFKKNDNTKGMQTELKTMTEGLLVENKNLFKNTVQETALARQKREENKKMDEVANTTENKKPELSFTARFDSAAKSVYQKALATYKSTKSKLKNAIEEAKAFKDKDGNALVAQRDEQTKKFEVYKINPKTGKKEVFTPTNKEQEILVIQVKDRAMNAKLLEGKHAEKGPMTLTERLAIQNKTAEDAQANEAKEAQAAQATAKVKDKAFRTEISKVQQALDAAKAKKDTVTAVRLDEKLDKMLAAQKNHTIASDKRDQIELQLKTATGEKKIELEAALNQIKTKMDEAEGRLLGRTEKREEREKAEQSRLLDEKIFDKESIKEYQKTKESQDTDLKNQLGGIKYKEGTREAVPQESISSVGQTFKRNLEIKKENAEKAAEKARVEKENFLKAEAERIAREQAELKKQQEAALDAKAAEKQKAEELKDRLDQEETQAAQARATKEKEEEARVAQEQEAKETADLEAAEKTAAEIKRKRAEKNKPNEVTDSKPSAPSLERQEMVMSQQVMPSLQRTLSLNAPMRPPRPTRSQSSLSRLKSTVNMKNIDSQAN